MVLTGALQKNSLNRNRNKNRRPFRIISNPREWQQQVFLFGTFLGTFCTCLFTWGEARTSVRSQAPTTINLYRIFTVNIIKIIVIVITVITIIIFTVIWEGIPEKIMPFFWALHKLEGGHTYLNWFWKFFKREKVGQISCKWGGNGAILAIPKKSFFLWDFFKIQKAALATL